MHIYTYIYAYTCILNSPSLVSLVCLLFLSRACALSPTPAFLPPPLSHVRKCRHTSTNTITLEQENMKEMRRRAKEPVDGVAPSRKQL